jgi:hypothetical protein
VVVGLSLCCGGKVSFTQSAFCAVAINRPVVRGAVGAWVFIVGGRWGCGWACAADVLWMWLVAAVVIAVPFVVVVHGLVVGSLLALFLFVAGVAVLVRRVGRTLRGCPVDVVRACPAWERGWIP